jgi:hypothetical protein
MRRSPAEPNWTATPPVPWIVPKFVTVAGPLAPARTPATPEISSAAALVTDAPPER